MLVKTISIVDYGLGNIGSIANMIGRIGHKARIVSTAEEIDCAEYLILPGVGAFDTGIRQIIDRGLLFALNRRVINDKVPTLGICLGAQIMTRRSDEGSLDGLGWFDAETVKFDFKASGKMLPLPNMGWRGVIKVCENQITSHVQKYDRFYFVHNFHFSAVDKSQVMLVSEYGYTFAAGLYRDNIFAVQFHPEKSHKYGMRLLEAFINV